MATIVTRGGKGSPLTNNEVDNNFINLNTELAGKATLSSLATVATTGSYSDLVGSPTNISSFTNDAGYITSSGSITGNADTATQLATARTISLAGDVTGSATFDGSANITITAAVADDSHAHIIGNIDGLQSALDGKAALGANSDITSMTGITGGVSTPDYIDFDTAATPTRATGRMWWDNNDNAQTLSLGLAGSDVTLRLGKELYFRVKATSAITKGQVVMFTGTVGSSGGLTAAPASGITETTGSYIMGVAAESIALNGWGYVTQFGLVRGLDTTGGTEAWTDGQILYYDPSVSGGLTKTVPSAPNAKVELAAVVSAHASNGSLFVRVSANPSLEQLSDVETSSASDTDLLQYNGTAGVWQHSPASGITVGNVSGTVAIANGGTGATSLTSGYVLKGNGTSPVSASVIYDNGTNVGIGTTSPDSAALLDVVSSNGKYVRTKVTAANSTTGYILANDARTWVIRANGSNSDALEFRNATSDRQEMVIDSSGRVGIGTSSPSGLLEINGGTGAATTGGTLIVRQDGDTNADGIALTSSNATSHRIWKDASGILNIGPSNLPSAFVQNLSGSVGIGTSSPSQTLQVQGTGYATSDFRAPRFYDSNNTAYYINPNSTSIIGVAADNTWLDMINHSETNFKLRFYNDGTNNGTSAPAFRVGLYYSNTENSSIHFYRGGATTGGFLTFNTDTGAERMRITSAGDVGIGTSSPFSNAAYNALTVGGTLRGIVACRNASNADVGYLFAASDNALSLETAGIGGIRLSALGANTIDFRTNNAQRMLINGSGSVTANVDVRAPIFYDSNNTGYYLDPASTSLSLAAAGPVRVGPASALPLNYASNYSANGGSIQLTLERTGTSVGWGGIGADNNNCFAAWNTTPAVQFRVTTGGAAFATESFRAPIFYDSNNTAYYADPASTSNLNALTLAGVLTPEDPDNFKQTSLSSLTSASINYPEANVGATSQYCPLLHGRFLQDAGYRTHLDVGVYKSTNNTWNEDYFYIASGGNDNYPTKEWKFITQATTLAHSDGYVTIDGSARAPIFYDSDNTARYVDPSSTSVFNKLTTSRAAADQLKLERTNSDNNVNIEFVGTSTTRYLGKVGGDLKWGASADLNNLGDTIFHDGYHPNADTLTTARTISLTGDATGSVSFNGSANVSISTTVVDDSHGHSFNNLLNKTSGTGTYQTSGDFRAPIFYDSDNTGYYFDGAGTSRANIISTNLGYRIEISTTGGWARDLVIGNTDASGNGLWGGVGNHGGIVYLSAGYTLGSSEPYLNKKFWTDGVGNTYSNTSSRAPIFYDSNNTGFFTNPASSSTMYEIAVTNTIYSSNWFRSYNSTGWYNQTYGGGIFMQDSTWVRVYNNKQFYSENYIQSGSSVRAPLFYDSNDTGYYLDPNSTSQIVKLRVISAGNSAGGNIKLGPAGEGSTKWSYITGAHYNDTSEPEGIAMIGAYAASGLNSVVIGGSIYEANPATDIQFWTHNASTHNLGGTQRLNIGSNGNVTAYVDVRAPIFYDSSNTNFYVNPDGTSNCNDIKAENLPYAEAGSAYGTENTFTTDGGVGANNISRSKFYRDNGGQFGTLGIHVQHSNNAGYALQIASTSYSDNTGTFKFRLKNAGTWTGATTLIDDGTANQIKSGYLQSNSNLRAPVFYDSNDTGRYADLSSTGDSIRASGDIVAFYSDDRLKDRGDNIANALDKVQSLNGFHYTANETAQKFGYKANPQVGVSAQEVEAVLPEVVKDAAIGHGYKTVDYAKLVPLLIEAIKELKAEVETLKKG